MPGGSCAVVVCDLRVSSAIYADCVVRVGGLCVCAGRCRGYMPLCMRVRTCLACGPGPDQDSSVRLQRTSRDKAVGLGPRPLVAGGWASYPYDVWCLVRI